MSDDGSYDGPQAGWRPDGLLSPGASAVVALTLAVLVLTGNNLMVLGTQALFNEALQSQGMTEYLTTWALGGLVPAAASLYLARRALAEGAAGWELVLARAAFVLAVVGLFYGVLLVVGALIHNP
ncbi:hypothetical protein ACT8ZV_07490 [Nocardioides sp. MAHUQ-72]|uniref:hypothetical protein n=1 Tax=unclassified Nocardioides TaxID=2615069 RepID=UPI003606A8E0